MESAFAAVFGGASLFVGVLAWRYAHDLERREIPRPLPLSERSAATFEHQLSSSFRRLASAAEARLREALLEDARRLVHDIQLQARELAAPIPQEVLDARAEIVGLHDELNERLTDLWRARAEQPRPHDAYVVYLQGLKVLPPDSSLRFRRLFSTYNRVKSKSDVPLDQLRFASAGGRSLLEDVRTARQKA